MITLVQRQGESSRSYTADINHQLRQYASGDRERRGSVRQRRAEVKNGANFVDHCDRRKSTVSSIVLNAFIALDGLGR